ncbi:MAG: hypothetical protein ACK42Y_10495 [Candidatus Thermochlorobacter sp.]
MWRLLFLFAVGFALYYLLRFLYTLLTAPKHIKTPSARAPRLDEIEEAEFKEVSSTPKSKS